MAKDRVPPAKISKSDVVRSDSKVTINQLSHYLEHYNLDDNDIQLLSEFRTATAISLLKGTYRISRRQLYRRAKKLTRQGLLFYIPDGKTKLYSLTKEGSKVIDILVSGCEVNPESVSRSAPSSEPLTRIIRSHNYYAELPIQSLPKSFAVQLKRANRFTAIKSQNMRNWVKHYGWVNFEDYEAYIEITTRNVFVRVKQILATSAGEADAEAARLITLVKAELEETFSTPTKAFRLGDYRLKLIGAVRTKHHAILLHPLAQKCKAQGYSIQGESWSIDASKGIPEAEATDAICATEDCDHELRDLERRSRARVGVMDLKEVLEDMSKVLDKLIESNKSLSSQVQTTSNSTGTVGQLLQQQQLFFTQLFTQQNQQIMTMLSTFQGYLERLVGGVN